MYRKSPQRYSDTFIPVFTHPLSWENHVTLAKTLRQQGAKVQAEQELMIAQEGAQVLGAQTSLSDLLTTWKNEPARQKQHEDYWQKILLTHPDYRDAYIQLAYLFYQTNDLSQARANIQKASDLDPNNDSVRQLVTFLNF